MQASSNVCTHMDTHKCMLYGLISMSIWVSMCLYAAIYISQQKLVVNQRHLLSLQYAMSTYYYIFHVISLNFNFAGVIWTFVSNSFFLKQIHDSKIIVVVIYEKLTWYRNMDAFLNTEHKLAWIFFCFLV